MPQRLLAAALTQVADTVGRIGESVARMETNQVHTAAHLSHMQRSLHEQTQGLARIEARQHVFQNTAAQLSRIETSTDHIQGALVTLISDHGATLGKVESIQDTLRSEDQTPSLRLASKLVEWAPKVLGNWAPISAAVVAGYKLGVPWLRQLLGF